MNTIEAINRSESPASLAHTADCKSIAARKAMKRAEKAAAERDVDRASDAAVAACDYRNLAVIAADRAETIAPGQEYTVIAKAHARNAITYANRAIEATIF